MAAPKPEGRYAIVGRRAGETFYTPHGVVATHPLDGGAKMSAAQKKYFEDEYGIERVGDVPPEPPAPELDERTKARLDANQAASDAQADEETRVLREVAGQREAQARALAAGTDPRSGATDEK